MSILHELLERIPRRPPRVCLDSLALVQADQKLASTQQMHGLVRTE